MCVFNDRFFIFGWTNPLTYKYKWVFVVLGGMTKNVYHSVFLNYTGFMVYDGIYFFLCMTGC